MIPLQQLQAIKLWHVAHRSGHPIEYHTWDGVLTLWMVGWMGEPAALLLSWPALALLCGLCFLAPAAYVKLRRRLHHSGKLRCDWLDLSQR